MRALYYLIKLFFCTFQIASSTSGQLSLLHSLSMITMMMVMRDQAARSLVYCHHELHTTRLIVCKHPALRPTSLSLMFIIILISLGYSVH